MEILIKWIKVMTIIVFGPYFIGYAIYAYNEFSVGTGSFIRSQECLKCKSSNDNFECVLKILDNDTKNSYQSSDVLRKSTEDGSKYTINKAKELCQSKSINELAERGLADLEQIYFYTDLRKPCTQYVDARTTLGVMDTERAYSDKQKDDKRAIMEKTLKQCKIVVSKICRNPDELLTQESKDMFVERICGQGFTSKESSEIDKTEEKRSTPTYLSELFNGHNLSMYTQTLFFITFVLGFITIPVLIIIGIIVWIALVKKNKKKETSKGL